MVYVIVLLITDTIQTFNSELCCLSYAEVFVIASLVQI